MVAAGFENPAIEVVFADVGVRVGFEVVNEAQLPIGGAHRDIPRMDFKTGSNLGESLGERDDIVPIGGVSAVDDSATKLDRCEVAGDRIEVRGEFLELQMIVGVVEQEAEGLILASDCKGQTCREARVVMRARAAARPLRRVGVRLRVTPS